MDSGRGEREICLGAEQQIFSEDATIKNGYGNSQPDSSGGGKNSSPVVTSWLKKSAGGKKHG